MVKHLTRALFLLAKSLLDLELGVKAFFRNTDSVLQSRRFGSRRREAETIGPDARTVSCV